jgi:ABC-type nitrate/sulfonate/bicarbonate transport system ATPase subunit
MGSRNKGTSRTKDINTSSPTPHSPLPIPLFYCENITKYYENTPVIQDISLELEQGGFISLLGPSGVGKTTLFNILAGVDKPESQPSLKGDASPLETGKVWLNGEDITGISGKVSYMLQKDMLFEYRTTLDNVILPLLIRGEMKKHAKEYAAGFFPMFGLSGHEKKYPSQLSGGMRQRAALLRTCLMNNPVILLDEPFSALDAITRRAMQSWYAEISGKMKFSTFFITHDVEEALVLSDTIYIMRAQLSEHGAPGRITNRIDVEPRRPRDAGFLVSKEFLEQKRLVLEAIEL